MSAHMTTPHTEKNKKRKPYSKTESVPWREVFNEDLQQHGETGIYLRGIRLREGHTQKELAAQLGAEVSQHHISAMEHGKRGISKAMAKRLGEILHTDYRMFL